MTNSPVTFRPGTLDDSYEAFKVMEESIADLNRRIGSTEPSSADDPEKLAQMWEERRGLYEHLGRTTIGFWLAERDERTVGVGRAIARDGVWFLTELFVTPSAQSAGIGKSLLSRTMSGSGEERRITISSPDRRAQSLYESTGLLPRFPIYYLWRKPEPVRVNSDLEVVPADKSFEHLRDFGSVDAVVLGHKRDADHEWLLSDRQGHLFKRDGRVVGYGYMGPRNGPFALLDDGDFPAVLAYAENQAAAKGFEHFSLEVPEINAEASSYLTGRGYVKDKLVAVLMSDEPIGDFEKYVATSPPFIL